MESCLGKKEQHNNFSKTNDLKQKLQNKTAIIGVIGLGYVGLLQSSEVIAHSAKMYSLATKL